MRAYTAAQAAGTRLKSVIPGADFGGEGVPVHFLHANGYPPACYRPLLSKLAAQYHVFGMLLRPLWPGHDPKEIRDWKPFSSDLLEFLSGQQTGSVVGVGHSVGAVVTLRAALHDPAAFRALVLIDPVLLPVKRIVQLRILRGLGLARRMNARVENALRRRQQFDSLEQLFAGYRRREVFRYLDDEQLRLLVEGITRARADGRYELAYSPEWEARIYETGILHDLDLWRGLPRLKLPTLIIRGAETDTFWDTTGQLVRRRNPAIRVASVPQATHLVPMEKPDQVFIEIQTFLRQVPTARQAS